MRNSSDHIVQPRRFTTEPALVPSLEFESETARRLLDSQGWIPERNLILVLSLSRDIPLPDWLHDYLASLIVGNIRKNVGRKAESEAAFDFRFADAFSLYNRALPVFIHLKRRAARIRSQRRRSIDADLPPHERALQYVLGKCRQDLGNISLRGLANALSRFRDFDRKRSLDFPDDDPNRHSTD